MTLARYKFLCALKVMKKEFTVDDLLQSSGLPKATVTTFLNRESRFVTRKGKISTGRPGGQTATYQIRQGEQDALKRECDRWQPGGEVPPAQRTEAKLEIENALLVVNELLSKLERARETEKPSRIEIVRLVIRGVERDLAELDERAAVRYRRDIQKLKERLEAGGASVRDPTRKAPRPPQSPTYP